MSTESDSPIEWVETDKFVMPVIPQDLQIRPEILALLHCVCFLEISGDDTVDPDWAVEALEHVSYYLLRLNEEDTDKLRKEMTRLATYAREATMHPQFVDLVSGFLEQLGLEEPE